MSKPVKVGNLIIGGGNPITIQSMTNVSVNDVCATLKQIEDLQNAGCDIIRIAVPTIKAVESFAQVRKQTSIPLVADIHFDYRLAIGAIEAGADKIRINPGNVSIDQLDAVVDCAKSNGKAIRIGVNGGSVNKESEKEFGGNKANALVSSLEKYVRHFESRNFDDIVLSLKSSDVKETIAINKEAAKLGYPLHLGVTEAGLWQQGLVKNAIGIGALLNEGIGDTIRVSLTADPVKEVYAAKDILTSLGLRKGVQFVSCPKCGRCTVNLEEVATQVYQLVADVDKNIKVAVMGCEVNGPGECKDADLGIAGANGKFVFFKKGLVYKTVESKDILGEFKRELGFLTNDH